MLDQEKYILAIHAGHTRIKWGLFESETNVGIWPKRLSADFLPVSDYVDWHATFDSLSWGRVEHCILTGSNLPLIERIENDWPESKTSPIQMKKVDLPIKINVDSPEKVGADRILNAIAVNHVRKPEENAIIIDTGTAITIDAVDSSGRFLGGTILPGILMGARALHEFTSTLPLIKGQQFLSESPTVIGKNTEAAIASGLYWGHLGAIKEIVQRMKNNLKGDTKLYLTGGAAPCVREFLPDGQHEPDLSLIGSLIAFRSAV